MSKIGDIQVWWIPQIPGKPFTVPVDNYEDGKRICSILAQYDIFQFENRIKPDYCNAGGVQRYENNGDGPEWCDLEEDEA